MDPAPNIWGSRLLNLPSCGRSPSLLFLIAYRLIPGYPILNNKKWSNKSTPIYSKTTKYCKLLPWLNLSLVSVRGTLSLISCRSTCLCCILTYIRTWAINQRLHIQLFSKKFLLSCNKIYASYVAEINAMFLAALHAVLQFLRFKYAEIFNWGKISINTVEQMMRFCALHINTLHVKKSGW